MFWQNVLMELKALLFIFCMSDITGNINKTAMVATTIKVCSAFIFHLNRFNISILVGPICKTRKGFKKKTIVAFTNNKVFILDFNILLSLFGLMFWPRVLSQTIPDCIRYIIGVFCYNFKSQTNILAS